MGAADAAEAHVAFTRRYGAAPAVPRADPQPGRAAPPPPRRPGGSDDTTSSTVSSGPLFPGHRRTRRATASRGGRPSTADDQGKRRITHSPPILTYSTPGGLRQDPGRAA